MQENWKFNNKKVHPRCFPANLKTSAKGCIWKKKKKKKKSKKEKTNAGGSFQEL